MREYNSSTDRQIVREAVRHLGSAGGFLADVATALRAAGIEWPANYNADKRPSTLALDADITAEVDGLRRIMDGDETVYDSTAGLPTSENNNASTQ